MRFYGYMQKKPCHPSIYHLSISFVCLSITLLHSPLLYRCSYITLKNSSQCSRATWILMNKRINGNNMKKKNGKIFSSQCIKNCVLYINVEFTMLLLIISHPHKHTKYTNKQWAFTYRRFGKCKCRRYSFIWKLYS